MAVDTAAEERRLAQLVRAHDRWRGRDVFNLLPSENAVSPVARKYLASDLAGRYTLPDPPPFDGEPLDNSYAGTKYADQIEQLADASARRLFRAEFATVRPLSGHIAAMSALAPLLPRGSKILAISSDQGGYDGYAPGFLPALFGWTVRPLPATGPGGSLREEDALEEVRRERPHAVILGQSFFLFPYPMRALAEELHKHDSLLFYDAAHVLGLIAGGHFQDPLREGADVVYGSTHKSFPGPQGGILLTNRSELWAQLAPALIWRIFDNTHLHRIASLAQTLLELERVGPAYAETTIANAKALASELAARGVPMVAAEHGFTASHQVHIDRPELRRLHHVSSAVLARRWEKQRLITDLIGRLGTAEVARLGLGPADMPRLVDLLVRGGIQKEKVAPEVLAWRHTFPQLKFA